MLPRWLPTLNSSEHSNMNLQTHTQTLQDRSANRRQIWILIYVSVSTSVHNSTGPYVHLSVHSPVCPSISPSACMSIHRPVCPSTNPLVYQQIGPMSVHQSIGQSLRPSPVRSSACLSMHPSAHHPISLLLSLRCCQLNVQRPTKICGALCRSGNTAHRSFILLLSLEIINKRLKK